LADDMVQITPIFYWLLEGIIKLRAAIIQQIMILI